MSYTFIYIHINCAINMRGKKQERNKSSKLYTHIHIQKK